MKKKGFTLIELLVVVAIIAVLVALLLPGLSAARAQARKLKCSSQLKQIFLVAFYYAEDNNGWINGTWRSTYEHWYTDFQNYSAKAGIQHWWTANNCPEENPDITFCYAINRTLSPNNYSAPFKFQSNREDLSTTLFLCDYIPGMVQVAPKSWWTYGFWYQDLTFRRLRHQNMVNVLLYDGHTSFYNDLDASGLNW